MFRRRKERSSLDELSSLMFPRKGWKRPFYYIYYRLRRRPGGPRKIAAGVACGVGISFTPFIGFHLITGYLMTLMLGGDVTAMVIGSLIGNPWTFPFFWAAAYYLGRMILGFTLPASSSIDLTNLSFKQIVDNPFSLLLPMGIGGVILGLIFGLLSFYITRSVVETYRKHRQNKLKNRRKELKSRLKDILAEMEADDK